MKKIFPYIVSAAALWLLAELASLWLGPLLAPRPWATLVRLWELGASGVLGRELGITVLRAFAGIFLANLLGLGLGLGAGLLPMVLRLITPLVAALQSCPPVIWVSLALVWAGTGSVVPVAVVFAATMPFIFSSTAQGVLGLDKRLFAMSALYGVPWKRRMASLILPGVTPYWLAAFSTSLAAGWKAAAVAEFLGSHEGVGARIFWAYRRLDMVELNAWALALIIVGVIFECAVVMPLRRKAANMNSSGDLRYADE